ncbi:MAG: protein-glutamate O-methyltransferase [Deltaproteobacteria bacterium]|nr:protein-glutamate O-methyltransferase [Deltaproteobacteria bacterium]MBN2671860.1 protein-glutamate O-methyltransferase [Deltaproteobacteria bacterium]
MPSLPTSPFSVSSYPGAAAWELSSETFHQFASFIYQECGISLQSKKRIMLQSRLQKRVRALCLSDYDQYFEYLKRHLPIELPLFISAITTNTTRFFRENHHFDYLVNRVLPEYQHQHRPLRIWSAGCSTGEEPYTLAMVLTDFYKERSGRFSILATDVDQQVLKTARRAVYLNESLQDVPKPFRDKYVMRGIDRFAGSSRMIPGLRNRVTFLAVNFMDPEYPIDEPVDIIFCRNVLIYFDNDTKRRIIRRFKNYLRTGGSLFIGHSETLHGISDCFQMEEPTVYRKGC